MYTYHDIIGIHTSIEVNFQLQTCSKPYSLSISQSSRLHIYDYEMTELAGAIEIAFYFFISASSMQSSDG